MQTYAIFVISFILTISCVHTQSKFKIAQFPSLDDIPSMSSSIVRQLSHIVVSAAQITEDSMIARLKQSSTNITALKSDHSPKFILGVGGLNYRGKRYPVNSFSRMMNSSENRKNFIRSVLALAINEGYDGLDIELLFPSHPNYGGGLRDRELFATLLFEFKNEIKRVNAGLSLSALVSAEVFSSEYYLQAGYDVPAIVSQVDWITLIGFDMVIAESGSKRTGIHSPLNNYKRSSPKISNPYGSEEMVGVSEGVKQWNLLGSPFEKIVLSFAPYGRSWKLMYTRDTGLGARSTGPGKHSLLSYDQVKSYLPSCTIVFEDLSRSKYAYSTKDKIWFSFEDVETVREKVTFAAATNLGGVMLWNMHYDDASYSLSTAAFELYLSAISLNNTSSQLITTQNSGYCQWSILCSWIYVETGLIASSFITIAIILLFLIIAHRYKRTDLPKEAQEDDVHGKYKKLNDVDKDNQNSRNPSSNFLQSKFAPPPSSHSNLRVKDSNQAHIDDVKQDEKYDSPEEESTLIKQQFASKKARASPMKRTIPAHVDTN